MPLRDYIPNKTRHLVGLVLLVIFLSGYLLPGNIIIPVAGADKNSWNHNTFWHYPWGKSVVHKGIDVFAPVDTAVIAATGGLVLYTGELGIGGKVVLVLGPKWRLHYYAHLKEINTSFGSFISQGKTIGSIGKTGNAKTRPPHLHYTILTIIPYPWRIDGDRQGWKKMFVLNPSKLLLNK